MSFLAYFGLMAAVVLLYICGIYLIERYTEKRKLNIQKIVLDVSCGYSAIVAAFFIDDALYFRGDFVDLAYKNIVTHKATSYKAHHDSIEAAWSLLVVVMLSTDTMHLQK